MRRPDELAPLLAPLTHVSHEHRLAHGKAALALPIIPCNTSLNLRRKFNET
jgi:hypothetical protein